jgi:hypothetical protein
MGIRQFFYSFRHFTAKWRIPAVVFARMDNFAGEKKELPQFELRQLQKLFRFDVADQMFITWKI